MERTERAHSESDEFSLEENFTGRLKNISAQTDRRRPAWKGKYRCRHLSIRDSAQGKVLFGATLEGSGGGGLKRREHILQLINLYIERSGKREITTESLLGFIEDETLPPNIAYLKYATKRELAALIATYAKDKMKNRGRTTFLF